MILLSIQFFPSKIQNLSLRFLFKLLWYNFPLFKIMVWSSWHHIYRSNIMFVTTWLKQRLIYLLSVFHDVYMYIFLVKLKSLTVITKKKVKSPEMSLEWDLLQCRTTILLIGLQSFIIKTISVFTMTLLHGHSHTRKHTYVDKFHLSELCIKVI